MLRWLRAMTGLHCLNSFGEDIYYHYSIQIDLESKSDWHRAEIGSKSNRNQIKMRSTSSQNRIDTGWNQIDIESAHNWFVSFNRSSSLGQVKLIRFFFFDVITKFKIKLRFNIRSCQTYKFTGSFVTSSTFWSWNNKQNLK